MASILPHLAQKDETTDLEKRYLECKNEGFAGIQSSLCPTPQAIIDQSHAMLLNIAWTRKVIVEQINGLKIAPMYEGNSVILRISEPPRGPLWNPMLEGVQKTSLLSWTSKMGAPSFSLAAGAPSIGGSCPGAIAGQSVVSDTERRKAAGPLIKTLGIDQVRLADCICQKCYASKGQYGAASNQFFGLTRLAWARRAVEVDFKGKKVLPGSAECTFVRVMIEAIENANFYMDGGKAADRIVVPEPTHWAENRFFRIHDSGDFFDKGYLRAWKNIANHFPDIIFWAPTRIWTNPKSITFVNSINKGESNLVLRPSGYHVNEHGCENLGPGWSGNTVVYDHDSSTEAQNKDFDWNCKAYEVITGASCREAEDPQGRTGCRTCWKNPEKRINYTLH